MFAQIIWLETIKGRLAGLSAVVVLQKRDFVVLSPCFEAKSPCFEAKSPCFEAKSPCFGAKSPCFEAKSPCFGAKSPCFEAKSPCFGAKSPCFGAKSPCFGAKSPCFGAKSPCFVVFSANKTADLPFYLRFTIDYFLPTLVFIRVWCYSKPNVCWSSLAEIIFSACLSVRSNICDLCGIWTVLPASISSMVRICIRGNLPKCSEV